MRERAWVATLLFHVVGHLVLHACSGVNAGEDEALLESCIETTVIGRREPDEIGDSVVRGDAVEMMALILVTVLVEGLRSKPCPCHEDMAVVSACSYFEIVLPTTAFATGSMGCFPRFNLSQDAFEAFGGFVLSQGVREETSVGRAIEGLTACFSKRTQS